MLHLRLENYVYEAKVRKMFPILQFVSAVKCPMPPWFEPKSVVGNWDFTSALAREYKDEIKYTCPEGYVFQVCIFLSNFCFIH